MAIRPGADLSVRTARWNFLTNFMLFSRRQLHFLSHDPRTLRRAILIIAAVFFGCALWAGVNRPAIPPVESVLDRHANQLVAILKAPDPDRTELLRALRQNAVREARWQNFLEKNEETPEDLPLVSRNLPKLLAGSSLPAGEQEAFTDWHEAMKTHKFPAELIPRLTSLAMPKAPSLPRTMAGDLQRISRDYQGSLSSYETAGAQPDGAEARRRAVELALSREWTEIFDRLMAQPAYYEAVHAVDDQLSDLVAGEQLDVRKLFQRTLAHSYSVLIKIDYLILSLLTASIWFVSLHKASRLPMRQWGAGLVALPLGVFSTVITLVLLSLQQARQGLTDSGIAGPALLFQIASVGLREEFSKLVCFLPLLLALRRGTPAQALMAASCVGLGFALEENINYYHFSGGASVLGRFVTATFMHIAMTGLTGLALFKFLRYPKNYGTLFLATFVSMVMLHGFYNFSQAGFDNPFSLELAGLFPFIIAGLAWYYFQTLRHEQDDAPQNLSAEAVFLLGTTVVMGTLLNYLVWENGWELALQIFVPSVLSSVLFGWLFHHFLRNA